MFGFPPILDGNAGIKFTRDADSGFPKTGIREIFYSIKDGNWTDANTWQTASGRVGILPSANDDVYVRNVVNLTSTTVINNLFISGRLILSATGTANITLNNITCDTGILDASTSSLSTINVNGNGSRITKANFLSGVGSVFAYTGTINQDILDLTYRTLVVNSTALCTKSLTSNLTLNGNLTVGSGGGDVTFELGPYDLTVTGVTNMGGGSGGGRIRKSASGNITFIGSTLFAGNGIDFSGNPNVEFRSGFQGGTTAPFFSTGTGVWSFTTANQSILYSVGGGNFNAFDCTLSIASGITLTTTGTGILQFNNTINGVDGTSVWRNATTVNFATLASVPSMTTGTWDFTTNANTIGYTGNYSATIPSYFTNFHNLTIGGTGTKTLGVNTTLNGNLVVNGLMECSTFNLTINGTTTFGTNSSFTKNGAGNLLFVGSVFGNNWDFKLTGNPNVEIRNGFNCQNTTTTRWDTGTGLWTFSTTNNQIFQPTNSTINMNCNVLISGAITVQFAPATGFPSRINMYGSIDGNNAASTLDNRLTLYFYDITKYLPMSTLGTFIFNVTSTSIIGYMFNGSITLPTTSYMGLVIAGTGTKTLLGNTTILANLRVEGTLQLSTFDLTVNGTTFVPNPGTLAKNSTGNVLFIGLLTLSGGGAGTSGNLNFSGNPNVELRNGLNNTNSGTGFTSGNGTYTFSTNNQNLDIVNTTVTFNGNVIIGNNIIVTQVNAAGAGFTGTVIMAGTLNGSNASSTYRIGSNGGGTPLTTNYQNTTQPMATGVLDTSTNLNTFIYGAGNQDVKGNPTAGQFQQYRNLRFSGSGTTKRLLGNINVQNTYTVDAGVTVNLNGFTKTP